MTKSNLIRYLAREYPTATCQEIGMAINESAQLVRAALGRVWRDASREYARRKRPGADEAFVRIMQRRIGKNKQRAAA